MKKLLAILTSALLLCTMLPLGVISVVAADAADLSYRIENGTVTITDSPWNIAGELVIPATMEGYPVTAIGDRAFYGCSKLTAVIIPDGVTTIGGSAFYSCTTLTSVTIPASVTAIWGEAFSLCSQLTAIEVSAENASYASVDGVLYDKDKTTLRQFPGGKSVCTIPNSVTTIGEYAFEGCGNLTSVTIPANVTTIKEYAFKSCSALTSVTIGDGVTTIGNSAFSSCGKLASVSFGNGITSIGNSAFISCTALTDAVLPDSVIAIGSYAFYNTAYYNDSSRWENDVLYLGKHLLQAKSTLSGAYAIKAGTLTVADQAFSQCSQLTSIDIPNGVTAIGNSAFNFCSALASVTLPDSIRFIGESAFNGTAYYNDASHWDNNVLYIGNHLIQAKPALSGAYAIKEGTYTVADYAFNGCSKLTSVDIPDSVITVGNDAFSYTALTAVILPNRVVTIGARAFSYCDKMTSVSLPDSVAAIRDYAFVRCDALEAVHYLGSEGERDAIVIGIGNEPLLNAAWDYGRPTEVDLDQVFQSKLNFLDQYYTLGAEYMIHTVCPILYSWEEAEANGYANILVPAAEFEAVLYRYFAPTEQQLTDIRNYPLFDYSSYPYAQYPFYNAELDAYNVFFIGGFGGDMPQRQYKGYEVTENGYTVYYQHITYDFLEIDDELSAKLQELNWPSTFIHNGYEYHSSMDGYCRVVSLDNYGNKYEVQYNDGIVRILSQSPYVDEPAQPPVAPGDANGDDKINNRDLGLLQQYLNFWNPTIETDACDVNNDGKINNRDLGLLQQYLNFWDVELG